MGLSQNDEPKPSRCANFKNQFMGLFAAVLCSIFAVASTLFLKKTVYFNSFEIAGLRYAMQATIFFIIAIYKKVNLLGDKSNRKTLCIRGMVGGCGMISFFTAVKLIDPSDAISLFSSNIIFVAILSRIILKDKFTIMHLTSLVFFVFGIVFITQPSFLIPNNQKIQEEFLNKTNEMIVTSNKTKLFSESTRYVIGVPLALFAGFTYALTAIFIKKLSTNKIHISVINLYAAYFGFPIALIISVTVDELGLSGKDWSLIIYEPGFVWEMFYVILSSVLGISSQAFFILAIQYEEPTKIAMYRTLDLLLTFIFQYFFLNIASNIFSITGSICIAIGMSLIMSFKIIDNKEQQKINETMKLENINENEYFEMKQSVFKKIIFFKF